MRGDGGVASEGRVVGVPKFHSWDKCTIPLTNINSCRLDIQRFLCLVSSPDPPHHAPPENALRRLVLQVYLGLNTLDFSTIRRNSLLLSY